VIARERSETARLLAHYDQPGPRYTSYPTAVEFHDGFGDAEYRERLAAADAHGDEPLSLYAHLPFCEERCLYCGCNIVVTRHRGVAAAYLEQLLLELELLARHLPHRRTLSQMHWGGGTPTYYAAADLERLFNAIAQRFEFTPDAEIGIEVDPRVTSAEQLRSLRQLGFNRLSMGVQDFDPVVQNRYKRLWYEVEIRASLVQHAWDLLQPRDRCGVRDSWARAVRRPFCGRRRFLQQPACPTGPPGNTPRGSRNICGA